MNELVYGKDNRQSITGIELGDNIVTLYFKSGEVVKEEFERYIIYKRPEPIGKNGTLAGNQEYKYFSKYKTRREYFQAKKMAPYPFYYTPKNDQQSYMLKTGTTMYKGMKYNDLKILSFDIETNGLKRNADSIVYIISATTQYKDQRNTVLFSLDEYDRQEDMINAFCAHVRSESPDVLTGHNIFGFDLPYLDHCSSNGLSLGRDGSTLNISSTARLFRKDEHKKYDYFNCRAYGIEIVDTFFLAMKYDFQNKYDSYGLKNIIKQEGLITEGRQFYDAASIKDNWKIDSEREKIKEYCRNDSQDALNLCDLMLPSYFYYVQSLPLGLQETILTASGSQINSIMVRSYLQYGHSIPESSERKSFKGAISFGNPGLYSHVNKVDVASLYPSIMLQYNIHDSKKDPHGNFIKIVREFTNERLKNKKLAKETGDRYYKDMEQAQKIMINSAYGFLGATGLNYNSPSNAALVTKYGREILQKGIDWVNKRGYTLINVDTDAFAYSTGRQLTPDEFDSQINEINSLFPTGIVWENDSQYRRFIVVKAKNYVLQDYDKNVTIKGSGLKATMKEPALQEFIIGFIDLILNNQLNDGLLNHYNKYALEILDVKDITRWSSKKTITKSVLNPRRTNEARILDALKDENVREGDRVRMFFETATKLCLNTNFKGVYDVDRLLEKLFKTVKIFETVLDVKRFPNYNLKRNKKLLVELETLNNNMGLFFKLG